MPSKKILKRYLITIIITSLVASALIGIFVLLIGKFGEIELRVLFSVLAIGTLSITGLANIRNIESSSQKRITFSIIGVVLSTAALLLVLGMIWTTYNYYLDKLWTLSLTFIILSVSFAHISLLLPSVSDMKIGYIKNIVYSTIFCILVVAVILIGMTYSIFSYSGDAVYRLLGVFAILDVLGTIISPISVKALSSKK